MAKVLVTGGKGKTGRRVARKLDERGIAHWIGTRNPANDNDVAFDWQQPDLARRAFEGIDAVYIVARPTAPTMLQSYHPFSTWRCRVAFAGSCC